MRTTNKKTGLAKHSKGSNLMNISIIYNGEKIKFNLFEELVISENKIKKEIQTQPTYYSFLCILAVKLKKNMDQKKSEVSRIRGEIFKNYKSKLDNLTNKPYSNDTVEAIIETKKEYRNAISEALKAEEDYGIIKACVDSFNQRSMLIQTLSANLRSEKF